MAVDSASPIRREDRFRKLGVAWTLLCFALALHVTDEALTGFLSVYNPTVAGIRRELPWFPLPQFEFGPWLGGLIVAVAILLLLTRFVARGVPWTRPLVFAFALLMVLNAVGHTLGTVFGRTIASVEFSRPMPGFYSSPFVLAASIYVLVQLRRSRWPSERAKSLPPA
jgi:hypothetical protein